MSAIPTSPPANPLLADATDGDSIETRILRAEQRLIAREERLLRDVRKLGGRVRDGMRPNRLLFPVLGGLATVASLWWGLRGRRPTAAGADTPVSARGPRPSFGGGIPWLRLVPMAWPLLPVTWRARVSPTTVTTAIAFGLPLIERLVGGNPSREPAAPQTMPHVDLSRFAGTWHEIARLPQPFEAVCDGQPSATYTPVGGVIDVENRCTGRDGKERVVRGSAQVVPGSGNAKLQISLIPAWLRWLPFAWADYWVLYVDQRYSVAVVGSPGRDFLWLLARRRRLSAAQLQALVGVAREQGFAVDKLKLIDP